MSKLEQTVLASLEAAAVKAEDALLAAVSGGADSTALLAALAALRGKRGGNKRDSDERGGGACRSFRLAALHVDHALRGEESRADAASVSALCDSLDVPCRIVSAPDGFIEDEARRSGRGVEAAARGFRHEALRSEAARIGARLILIAHTRNDALENTLLRILRGAGPAGLAAMPERKGAILRPLITVERAGICEYLKERGLSWREDSTNSDERFLRNRVRLRLAPLLDEHFPDWRQNIAALSETQALTAEFLETEAERRLAWEADGGGLNCPLSRFVKESQILREEALFLAYDRITAEKSTENYGVDAPPPEAAPPRRVTARNFARKITQTFGGMELSAHDASSGGAVSLSARKQKPLEECASILVNKPGFYRFKNFSIECLTVPDAGNAGMAYRFIVREANRGV